jgi:hypothetical protein
LIYFYFSKDGTDATVDPYSSYYNQLTSAYSDQQSSPDVCFFKEMFFFCFLLLVFIFNKLSTLHTTHSHNLLQYRQTTHTHNLSQRQRHRLRLTHILSNLHTK